ncbi:MAG: NAD(P)/FAD-dependent oxidoreductase [Alphaproteobacteria bacterium]|jgi:predicted Rossmann fold flavoprotein|nr:NAD(P)/FAD-dependent oxidoreductase [Alphaproteobacteria bacterium]QQS57890.1 MAG: NAD(P)/FAD-dependent oxidoreductase [Alphaproteobacteria bacterium]
MKTADVIIIGAGAAGLMCAGEAAARGRTVRVIEHTGKIGEKIRISGGGRCNFTNLHSGPENFISQNPHFCKSALSRFTPQDFIEIVKHHGIAFHEKPYEDYADQTARGQLFCDGSSKQIIDMLISRCIDNGAVIEIQTKIKSISKNGKTFHLKTDQGEFESASLVIASGGLSIPKIGASNFGYEQAKKFGLEIVPPRAALVPLTFDQKTLERTAPLSGLSIDARVSYEKTSFREGLLFTHRGLSGPSILQISTYWEEGKAITVDLIPEKDALDFLKTARKNSPKQKLRTILSDLLPQRLAHLLAEESGHDERMADLSDPKLAEISALVKNWSVLPAGTEGYRTAEVTLGGVDTSAISSKTFEAKKIPGLYFIGEVLDVTGHLGGHNFQWAWASGWCAGQEV